MARPKPVPPYLSSRGCIGLLELLKDSGTFRFGDTDAGVSHGKNEMYRFLRRRGATNIKNDLAFVRKLDGIGHEIDNRLFETSDIAV